MKVKPNVTNSGLRAILLTIALSLILFAPAYSFAHLTIKANHDHIKINFFYHGDEVTVSGSSDANADIIVKITSPEVHQIMKKKGKVAGLLWMNVGTLNFEHIPNLYMLYSSGRLEEILSREEMDKYIIGYPSLFKRVEIHPVDNEADKERWFREFVKFKEASKLYNVAENSVSITKGGEVTKTQSGLQDYHLRIAWPYQAPPGEYTITVYAVKDKRVIESAEAKVRVEQVGGVKILADMAKNNSILYGIISIVVAVAAGFGVGMIFRKGGSH